MQSVKKITYAGTKDMLFFNELWSSETFETMEKLNFEVEVPDFEYKAATPKLWQDFLKNSDAIITTWNSPCINQSILDVAPNLKIMGHAAGSLVGYTSPELFEAGIKVSSANHNMAHAVAEWCLMGALMGRRNVATYSKISEMDNLSFPNRANCKSITNSVVGIWGFGAVASILVEMLKPLLPQKIQVVCSHLSDDEAKKLGVEIVDFGNMVASSDIIFTLKGLNSKTQNYFDKNYLKLIKDGSTLVNGGRAQFFNEQDFYDELAKKRFNAVLDVYHEEPLPQDNFLHKLDNVILTPHNAGYPSRFSYISTLLNEFDRFFNNHELKYEIQQEKIAFMTVNMNK